MRELYKLIAENKDNKECVLISGIAKDTAGEKIFLVNGEIVYKTQDAEKINADDEDIFTERFFTSERIIICGAGTVGQEVIKLSKQLGLTVAVLEDREEYADIARQLGADEVLCMEYNQGLTKLDERSTDYYVVVTREHKFDKECLEHILNKKNAYVGMMASRTRAAVLKSDLIKEGKPEADVDKIHSPIGLKIKAETPAEIAVSICAEIINQKNDVEKTEGFTKAILDGILSANPSDKMILATIVKRTGSAPRDVGTKMLICENGDKIGTVGGGWIEAEVIDRAHKMIFEDIKNDLYETDKNSEEAMLCGGYETIYLEMI